MDYSDHLKRVSLTEMIENANYTSARHVQTVPDAADFLPDATDYTAIKEAPSRTPSLEKIPVRAGKRGERNEQKGAKLEKRTEKEDAAAIAPHAHGEMTTVIDRLYDYISDREVTTISEISERLGVKTHQVEKMIEMLENGKLIKVKYSLVPNGNVEVLVSNREFREKPKDVSHEERIRRLKQTITNDVDRVENAISSMEHHLNFWSSEAEEKVALGGHGTEESLVLVNQESIRLEKTLEQVRKDIVARVGALKKRLADMRENINTPLVSGSQKGPERGKGGIFGIKNPFNF